MQHVASIILVIIAALMIFAILSQSRGEGLSGAIGGGSDSFTRTKRGPEKVLFVATIIFSIAFFALALATPFLG